MSNEEPWKERESVNTLSEVRQGKPFSMHMVENYQKYFSGRKHSYNIQIPSSLFLVTKILLAYDNA